MMNCTGSVVPIAPRQRGAYRALIAAEDYESDDDPMQAIFGRLEEESLDEEF